RRCNRCELLRCFSIGSAGERRARRQRGGRLRPYVPRRKSKATGEAGEQQAAATATNVHHGFLLLRIGRRTLGRRLTQFAVPPLVSDSICRSAMEICAPYSSVRQ